MKSIIQNFTNDSWFRRGTLKVQSYKSYMYKGQMLKEANPIRTYTRKFFIHQTTDKDIRNAGLGEITNQSIVIHAEFPLNFSDGVPTTYTLASGEVVQGVTMSDDIFWQGDRYKIIYHGNWSSWRHYYYIAEKISKGSDIVC